MLLSENLQNRISGYPLVSNSNNFRFDDTSNFNSVKLAKMCSCTWNIAISKNKAG